VLTRFSLIAPLPLLWITRRDPFPPASYILRFLPGFPFYFSFLGAESNPSPPPKRTFSRRGVLSYPPAPLPPGPFILRDHPHDPPPSGDEKRSPLSQATTPFLFFLAWVTDSGTSPFLTKDLVFPPIRKVFLILFSFSPWHSSQSTSPAKSYLSRSFG